MSGSRPSVLIVAAKWWPSSARMAIALLRHGCRVSALCPAGHPLLHVSDIDLLRRYSSISPLASLRRSIKAIHPDVIIPCDDGVVAQLHELYRRESTMRPLIEASLGSPDSYSIVGSRYRLLGTSVQLGIPVPKTVRITTADDLVQWHRSAPTESVVKIDGESGGNGVRICRSLDESLAALKLFSTPTGSATALKRLAIDRDPLALWMSRRQAHREITIQEFIPGRPANSLFVCRQGKVLSDLCVSVVASDGPTGAATIIRRIENQGMTQAAQYLASRLKLTGFYGLDFVMASGTNIPYLIEMNPRCTQLGHLEFADQGSLAGVFSAAWRGESRPLDIKRPIRAQLIAFFPQARVAGGVCNQFIDAGYHDVPIDEPRLVDELMLRSWPERHWVARLYHSIKPRARSNPVVFEEINSTAAREVKSLPENSSASVLGVP